MQIDIKTTVVFILPAEREAAEEFKKKYPNWYCLAEDDNIAAYVKTELTNFPLFAPKPFPPEEQEKIVTSKDCRYAGYSKKDGKLKCYLWNLSGSIVNEDGYCVYGEKKKDESMR